MKRYKGFLLDLDGTIYRGKEIIPEAVRFIEQLKKAGLPFLYLTNNSSTTPEKVAARLTSMGLLTETSEVYTSSMATAAYLQEQEKANGKTAYVIGEEGLLHALTEAGYSFRDHSVSYVVVGIDRSFTYDKLDKAATAIRNGATFIATNQDAALPTEGGLRPGNGSLVAAVSVASGTKPLVVGKPETIIVNYALEKLGTSKEETLIIGDNLYTDISAGANSGIDSLLVLTGFSSAEDAAHFHAKPTYIEENLLAWWEKHACACL